jgi:hypothetical protein
MKVVLPERLGILIMQLQDNWINENLAKCTPEQQALFEKMYPGGPKRDQILNAADQIYRTIVKNNRE